MKIKKFINLSIIFVISLCALMCLITAIYSINKTISLQDVDLIKKHVILHVISLIGAFGWVNILGKYIKYIERHNSINNNEG